MEKVKDPAVPLKKLLGVVSKILKIHEDRIKGLEAKCGMENVAEKRRLEVSSCPNHCKRAEVCFKEGSNQIYDSPKFRKGEECSRAGNPAEVPGNTEV